MWRCCEHWSWCRQHVSPQKTVWWTHRVMMLAAGNEHEIRFRNATLELSQFTCEKCQHETNKLSTGLSFAYIQGIWERLLVNKTMRRADQKLTSLAMCLSVCRQSCMLWQRSLVVAQWPAARSLRAVPITRSCYISFLYLTIFITCFFYAF